jgi:hypothetical protein
VEKLLDLCYVTISYLPEQSCLVQTWKSFCTTEEYMFAQEKCVEFIIEKGCKGFISDTTNAGPLKMEAIRWASTENVPKLKEAGIRSIDLVVPKSAFTNITIEYFQREIGSFIRCSNTFEQAFNAILCR